MDFLRILVFATWFLLFLTVIFFVMYLIDSYDLGGHAVVAFAILASLWFGVKLNESRKY